jgi:hypothetical protein
MAREFPLTFPKRFYKLWAAFQGVDLPEWALPDLVIPFALFRADSIVFSQRGTLTNQIAGTQLDSLTNSMFPVDALYRITAMCAVRTTLATPVRVSLTYNNPQIVGIWSNDRLVTAAGGQIALWDEIIFGQKNASVHLNQVDATGVGETISFLLVIQPLLVD